MAKKNIVILGNGFDLALGLPTKYADFCNSKYWPINSYVSTPDGTINLNNFLYNYIQNNRDTLGNLRWIDLEELIARYVRSETKKSVKFESEIEISHSDKETLETIKNTFIQYIIKKVEPRSLSFKNSICSNVIKQIADNGTFNKVYTFNYTRTEDFLNDIAGWKPAVIHLHGRAFTYGDNIILGVGDGKYVPSDYKFVVKARQKGFYSHDLNEDLNEAEQIIFYGLSFGESDLVYFRRFFEETVNNHNSKKKKKIIHIFTLNEESKNFIEDAFENAGLEMRDIYSCMDIRFYIASNFGIYINGREDFEYFKQTMEETKSNEFPFLSSEVDSFMKRRYGIS